MNAEFLRSVHFCLDADQLSLRELVQMIEHYAGTDTAAWLMAFKAEWFA
jgi:hypothetical protein